MLMKNLTTEIAMTMTMTKTMKTMKTIRKAIVIVPITKKLLKRKTSQ